MVIVLIVHDLKKKSHDICEEERKIIIGVFAVISIICIIVLCVNIGTIIKCKAFPEKAMYDSIKKWKFLELRDHRVMINIKGVK